MKHNNLYGCSANELAKAAWQPVVAERNIDSDEEDLAVRYSSKCVAEGGRVLVIAVAYGTGEFSADDMMLQEEWGAYVPERAYISEEYALDFPPVTFEKATNIASKYVIAKGLVNKLEGVV